MGKTILLLMLALAGWQGYDRYTARHRAVTEPPLVTAAHDTSAYAAGTGMPRASHRSYACDGRTHCSQMTSCAEATWFLRNCPGVKMDGDNDGVPCERQWC